jgi:hypothetical protein
MLLFYMLISCCHSFIYLVVFRIGRSSDTQTETGRKRLNHIRKCFLLDFLIGMIRYKPPMNGLECTTESSRVRNLPDGYRRSKDVTQDLDQITIGRCSTYTPNVSKCSKTRRNQRRGTRFDFWGEARTSCNYGLDGKSQFARVYQH